MKTVYMACNGKIFHDEKECLEYEKTIDKEKIVKRLKKIIPCLHELHWSSIIDHRVEIIEILSDGFMSKRTTRDVTNFCNSCRNRPCSWDNEPCSSCEVISGYPTNMDAA